MSYNPVLGFCGSNVKANKNLSNYSYDELISLLKNPIEGTKEGSYFIRTAFKDITQGRNDTNTQSTANILILDGDSSINTNTGEIIEGAPSPLKIHENIKKSGINHLIYRSYSHGTKGNRYRIVFETEEPYTKADLKSLIDVALALCGEGLMDVKENHTWSQPWYLPRKPPSDKSEFTFFECNEGRLLSLPKKSSKKTEYPKQYKKNTCQLIQGQISPIEQYNEQHSIESELLARGDIKIGKRWKYAHSSSNEPGINIKDNLMYSHHGSDPLNDDYSHDAFDLMQSRNNFNHGQAIKYAAQNCILSSGLTVDKHNKQIWKSKDPTNHQAPVENKNHEFDFSHDQLAIDLGKAWWDKNARFCNDIGSWLFWDVSRWVIDSKLYHMTLIRRFTFKKASEVKIYAKQQNDPKKDQKIKKWANSEAKNLRSNSLVSAVERMTQSNHKSVACIDDFDTDIYKIGTPEQTVNFKLNTRYPAIREDQITKLTAVSPEDGTPELWLTFLSVIFKNDKKVIQFMKTLCGYCLTGSTSVQKMFFFYGGGANGKSVFIDTLFFIMGDYARRAPANLFLEQQQEEHSTGLAGLRGSRCVIGSELEAGKTWKVSVIKDLTGGDVITARLMRQNYFDFKPQFTLLISGNHQPRLKSVDESIKRRMVLVPFNVTITPKERDPDLAEKLKNEAGKILNWMIEGSVIFCKKGLEIPKVIQDSSDEYIQDEDALGDFINSNLIEGGEVRFSEVYQDFMAWSKRQGIFNPWTERSLRKSIKERGYKIRLSNHNYILQGLSKAF